MYFSKDANSVPTFESPWIHRGWTPAIHTVNGFGIVNKAEVDVFLELSCFFDDPVDVGNLISDSSAFSKTSLNIWKFTVHVLLKPGLENSLIAEEGFLLSPGYSLELCCFFSGLFP